MYIYIIKAYKNVKRLQNNSNTIFSKNIFVSLKSNIKSNTSPVLTVSGCRSLKYRTRRAYYTLLTREFHSYNNTSALDFAYGGVKQVPNKNLVSPRRAGLVYFIYIIIFLRIYIYFKIILKVVYNYCPITLTSLRYQKYKNTFMMFR